MSLSLLRVLQIVMVSGCALTLTQSMRGQDALRTAVQGDEAYRARSSTNYLPEPYRMHAGPVEFTANVAYGLEWNDNVFLLPENKQSDLIQHPQLNLLARWPISEKSSISFGIGVSYLAYTDHSELNGLVVTPNTDFAWDIRVKDCVVTFYDRFSYLQDVLSVPTISGGTGEFPRIENTIGARVRWFPSRYVFELGYGHYNFLPVGSASPTFDYLKRSAEQFFGRAGFRVAENTSMGIEASTSFTHYDLDVQSDNVNISAGPYLEWQVTESWNVSLRGGLVYYSFDNSASQPAGGDLNSYYFGLTTENHLTDHIRHGVSIVRDVQQGFDIGSHYIENILARYFVYWDFHRSATLYANVSYQYNNEPQVSSSLTYNLYGAGLGLTLRPTDHVELSLNYSYATRDASVSFNNYTQNVVFLNLSYRF